MTETRRCPRCGETKELTEEHWYVYKRARVPGRPTGYCRACQGAAMRAHYAARSEYARSRHRRVAREYARRTRGYDPARYRVRDDAPIGAAS